MRDQDRDRGEQLFHLHLAELVLAQCSWRCSSARPQVTLHSVVILLQGTLERKAAEVNKIIDKKLGMSLHCHTPVLQGLSYFHRPGRRIHHIPYMVLGNSKNNTVHGTLTQIAHTHQGRVPSSLAIFLIKLMSWNSQLLINVLQCSNASLLSFFLP